MERGEEKTVSGISLRRLNSLDDYAEAVCIEQRIWGFEDIDVFPAGLFVIAQDVGGGSFGAFDGPRMIGFCLAVPGIKPGGRPFLHSHMLGVLPEYRDCGVGRLLKLEQRKDALSRGVGLIEWTFDPLELKNAWFNIEILGAVIRRYIPNRYGSTTSPLHGGLPTDRCVAEWALDSPWVEATLTGCRPRIRTERRVEIPTAIGVLRRESPEEARAIQMSVAERLVDAFASGLAIVGFERDEDAGTYLLGRWDSA
jgi:predicted GNAT superfamily acetyltransferase